MTSTPELNTELRLKRGAPIKNRLAKSAMSEQLGNRDHNPDQRLFRLYRTWAEGGIGLAMTGNVMIDRNALGNPRTWCLMSKVTLTLSANGPAKARSTPPGCGCRSIIPASRFPGS